MCLLTVVGLPFPFRIGYVCATVFELLAPFHNGWTLHCIWSIHCRCLTMNLPTRETFCPQKTFCSEYFNVGVSFQLSRHFFHVLRINDCHYPNEIATVGSRGTHLSLVQASLFFRHAAIRVGTSITYFLNARCS
ncbi:hypothetical protein AVEN_48152-1 [Araneus ventricosus]|uniref:Secreted protein n=1 Tax=Araneus ventricosus TaxID=182803 RepID=A0A4Y2F823_ARAVE|nr:hypothetical protein AVEN_48152-1 [Araneus ventricosus]